VRSGKNPRRVSFLFANLEKDQDAEIRFRDRLKSKREAVEDKKQLNEKVQMKMLDEALKEFHPSYLEDVSLPVPRYAGPTSPSSKRDFKDQLEDLKKESERVKRQNIFRFLTDSLCPKVRRHLFIPRDFRDDDEEEEEEEKKEEEEEKKVVQRVPPLPAESETTISKNNNSTSSYNKEKSKLSPRVFRLTRGVPSPPSAPPRVPDCDVDAGDDDDDDDIVVVATSPPPPPPPPPKELSHLAEEFELCDFNWTLVSETRAKTLGPGTLTIWQLLRAFVFKAEKGLVSRSCIEKMRRLLKMIDESQSERDVMDNIARRCEKSRGENLKKGSTQSSSSSSSRLDAFQTMVRMATENYVSGKISIDHFEMMVEAFKEVHILNSLSFD
jgi:hypothetical protein